MAQDSSTVTTKAKRATTIGVIAAAVLALGSAAFVRGSSESSSEYYKPMASAPLNVIACINSSGVIESTRQGLNAQTCAHTFDRRVSWPVTAYPAPTTPTTKPPVVTTTTVAPTTTTSLGLRRCFGVPLTTGQADINANGTDTTFCLSGTHNWSLAPKAGDQIISDQTNPGILDGGNSTQYALTGSANNVVLDHVEVRNYTAASQQGAIHGSGSDWILRNLQVHDNGVNGVGGDGSSLGVGWQILGGRYYNNRQNGLAGGVGTVGQAQGTVVDGAEIDHNNFTNDSYTTANISCGFEAGGIKWVGSNNTFTNLNVHDNSCRGLWADGDALNSTITNSRVTNNWQDGIMIEISGSATISGNTVSGNGFHSDQVDDLRAGCTWGWGSGILISTAGNIPTDTNGPINITGNTVTGNCSTITGIEQNRGTGFFLGNVSITGNTLVASSDPLALNKFGFFVDTGDDLTNNNLAQSSNTLTGVSFCGFNC